MKNSFIYLFTFLAIQLMVSLIIPPVWALATDSKDMTVGLLIVVSVVSSLIAIAVFLRARWAEVSPTWLRTRSWFVLFWSVMAALGALIPSAWLQEHMPELPNLVEHEFDQLLTNRWGYLTIGLLAPLAEEIVFRGAVLKTLLGRMSPWIAIVVSSLFFAAAHLNPAQLPHAFLIGLLLGWMYWRTGSILPGMAYHWANNSAAYALYQFYPDPNIQLIDIFKGSEQHVLMAIGFSMLILLPAIYQLHLWMKRA